MGSGIAEVFARAGRTVLVHEADAAAADRGRRRIHASVARAVQAGRLDEQRQADLLGRITIGTDLSALAEADLVVEAASESEPVKLDLFRVLDRILPDDAVLASNTSSIPIMKLGTATGRAEHVIGMHFFNPVPVLPLVEIVPSLLTADATTKGVRHVAEMELGKTVIVSPDRAGFIVNALLVPYLLSGIRMLESGFASAHDIDVGMERGCSHPMGPLRLCDLIGLDTVKAIADSLYAEFKEPLFAPPPMLLRMVQAGLLGRKSGRGFHEHQVVKDG